MSSSIQRAIRFNVYRRSLGYYKDLFSDPPGYQAPYYRDHPVNLILNGNFEKGRMGNLIILEDEGYNTSVILDAITGFNNKNEHGDIKGDKCLYSHILPWEIHFLETAICYKNDKHVTEYVIDDENRGKWREYDIPEHIHADISIDTVKSELKAIATILNGNKELEYDPETYYPTNRREMETYYQAYREKKDKTDSDHLTFLNITEISPWKKFNHLEEKIFDVYQYLEDKYSNIKQNPDDTDSIWDKIVSRNFETVTAYMNFKKVDAENTVDDSLSDQFEKRLSEKLGVPAIPTVHRYHQYFDDSRIDGLYYGGNHINFLSREDLKNLNTGDSPKLKFWRALFNSVENISIDRIIAAYEQADAIMGTLINGRRVLPGNLFYYPRYKDLTFIPDGTDSPFNDIGKELEPLLPRLTELADLYFSYFADNDYELKKFDLLFNSAGIELLGPSPREENNKLVDTEKLKLDLFCSIIAENNLKPGDIVIMDDSAIHKGNHDMSPQEQAAYRKFIKDFAVKNDILVILTTRSPFLIDPDNYEEVITGNSGRIYNLSEMLPIHLRATLRENTETDPRRMRNPDDPANPETKLVWVDSMTTYIYLTMFKKIFGIKNMTFIPCYPHPSSHLMRVISDLTKKHRNIILTNGDNEGKRIYDEYKLYDEYKELSSDNNAFYSLNMIYSRMIADKDNRYDRYGPAIYIEDLFSIEDQEKYGDIINSNCHDFYEPNYKYYKYRSSGKSALDTLDILKAAELKIHAKEEDFSEETIRNFKKLFKLLSS